MNRPMPKSYLTEAEREELRAKGLSDNVIFVKESAAAREAKDFDTGWDWLALADLPDYSLLCLKNWYGAQFIRDKGFKTEPAEKRYGKDWLERDIPYGE